MADGLTRHLTTHVVRRLARLLVSLDGAAGDLARAELFGWQRAPGWLLPTPHVPAPVLSFYVDPVSGNDSTGNGTSAAPWQTFEGAVSNLRTASASAPSAWPRVGDVMLYLKAGTYQAAAASQQTVEITFNNAARAPHENRWFIVQPAPGVSRDDVIVKPPAGATGSKYAIKTYDSVTAWFGSYVQLRDLTIDGEATRKGLGDTIGVYVNQTPFFQVVGLHVKGMKAGDSSPTPTTKAQGIFSDSLSTDLLVWESTVEDIGTTTGTIDAQEHGIYAGGHRSSIVGNVVHSMPNGFSIQVYSSGAAINDTLISANTVVAGAGIEKSCIILPGHGSRQRVVNNILQGAGQYGIEFVPATFTGSGNVIDRNISHNNVAGARSHASPAGWTITNDSTSDPLLTSPPTNVTPASGSPAIGAGAAGYTPPDAAGVARANPSTIGALDAALASYVEAAAAVLSASAVAGAGQAIRQGAAVADAASTLSAAGAAVLAAASALAGASSVAGAGQAIRQAAAATTGTSALTTSGMVVRQDAGALVGSSVFAAAGVRIALGASGFVAASTVSASGALIAAGVAPVSGASGVAAAASRIAGGSAGVAGASTVSFSAGVVASGAASLTGASALQVAALRIQAAAAAIVSASALESAGTAIRAAAALVAGSSLIEVIGDLAGTGLVEGAVSLTAASQVLAQASATLSAAIAATGSGSVEAAGVVVAQATAAVAAASTVQAVASRIATAASPFTASSTVAAVAVALRSASAAVTSAAAFSAAALRLALASTSVASSSTVAASGSMVAGAAVTLPASSVVLVAASGVKGGALELFATSGLGGAGVAVRSGGASLFAASSFIARAAGQVLIGRGGVLLVAPRGKSSVVAVPAGRGEVSVRPSAADELERGA